jgi:transposase
LQGDPESKYRLKVVLATLTGEMLVDEAYEELGVGPTQFANLRKQMLQGALDGLQPRPVGRPRRVSPRTDEEVQAMEDHIAELEHELTLLRSRLELAILPLLKPQRRSKSRGQTPPPGEASGPTP